MRVRSSAKLLGIVLAAIVALTAVGAVVMSLTGRNDDASAAGLQPTLPTVPARPSVAPRPTAPRVNTPATQPPARPVSPRPTVTRPAAPRPAATTPAVPRPQATRPVVPRPVPDPSAVELGNSVWLVPAPEWQVQSTSNSMVLLAKGRDEFVGTALRLPAGTNAAQTCNSHHRELAQDYTNGKFSIPKPENLGSPRLSGASCAATVTVANGGDAFTARIYSLVSVRADGLTAVGTMYSTEDSDSAQLDAAFSFMMNSMIRSQLAS